MFLYTDLQARVASAGPVRVGLIGAGKFGSMFLSQVTTTDGLEVNAIADLDPAAAIATCISVGWSKEQIDQTLFTDDAQEIINKNTIDVIVEATGNPAAGIYHARLSIDNGVPVSYTQLTLPTNREV